MNVIKLNNGTEVRVSPEDHERLSGYSWSQFRNGRAYRKELIPREERGGKKTHRTLLLHREVMGVDDDRQVIFRDGDASNCTRDNLVVVDATFRPRQRAKKGGSSQFRGVGWNRAKGMWQAYVRVNGKLRHLGFFPEGTEGEQQAARAYDEVAKAEFGELAVLNFPRTRRRRLAAHASALLKGRPRLVASAPLRVEPTQPTAPAAPLVAVPAGPLPGPVVAVETDPERDAPLPAAPAENVEALFQKPVSELTPEELEVMKARFLGDRYRARPRRLGRVG
ncbi:MAG TPA: hypothetical protein VF615_17730 [Longimicrobiaceae bacterium]|jgi:hypothetical protein